MSPTPSPAIVVHAAHLKMTYGRGRTAVEALRGIDFEVRTGECLGLLGPNGSGKSTTLKLVLGTLRPTGGDLVVFGGAPGRRFARAATGYVPEEARRFGALTGRETVDLFARLQGVRGRAQRRQRVEEALGALETGLASNPGSISLLVSIGETALRLGDKVKAAWAFEEVLTAAQKQVESLQEKLMVANSRVVEIRAQLEEQQATNRDLMEANTRLENEIKTSKVSFNAVKNELETFKVAMHDIHSEASRTSGRVRQRYFKLKDKK